jgi:hypothetical protein
VEEGAVLQVEYDGETQEIEVEPDGSFVYELDTKDEGEYVVTLTATKENKKDATVEVTVTRQLSKKEKEAAFKKDAKEIDYKHFSKNPDKYAGDKYKVTGQIVQILEENNYTIMRLAVTKDRWGWNSSDIVWVEYPGETDYVEDDVVTIYGTVVGKHSYESQAGWEISVPAVIAGYIEQ